MACSNASLSTYPQKVDEIFQHKETEAEPGEREKSSQSSESIGDEFLVDFDTVDPTNPMKWSRAYRWYLTLLASIVQLCATFSSSAPSGIMKQLISDFHMSTEVSNLTVALFVVGYCLGPILWGPLSEEYGRRRVFLLTSLAYTGFQIGCALSKNTASILVFRLLSGIFAAAPLSNSGAVISDIWDAETRGKAIALVSAAPFAGPAIGPIIGGYIDTAGVSWQWLFWASAIFSGACLIMIILTFPETYKPTLLHKKAKALRAQRGDNRYYTTFEHLKLPFLKQLSMILSRSFKIMMQEPMLNVINIYLSFVYGCVYLLFEAYPVVFSKGHHMSSGATGLMFIPFLIGSTLSVVIYMIVLNPRYKHAIEKYKPDTVPPEKRLGFAKLGAPLFAVSFFWFGWTSYPSISFWVPMLSGLFSGFAYGSVFIALLNYIVDTYLYFAASALATNIVCRSLAGAFFPLFATQMYEKLNPRWASTLIGCFATIMVPIPFALSKYGAYLRQQSKNAPTQQSPGV